MLTSIACINCVLLILYIFALDWIVQWLQSNVAWSVLILALYSAPSLKISGMDICKDMRAPLSWALPVVHYIGQIERTQKLCRVVTKLTCIFGSDCY